MRKKIVFLLFSFVLVAACSLLVSGKVGDGVQVGYGFFASPTLTPTPTATSTSPTSGNVLESTQQPTSSPAASTPAPTIPEYNYVFIPLAAMFFTVILTKKFKVMKNV